MKKLSRKLTTLLFGALLITSSSFSFAGVCGTGYIEHVYGGGWNLDGLVIKLDHEAGSTPPNTFHQDTIRFSTSMTEKRLDMIQGIALLALANGNRVQIFSHNLNAQNQADCSNATQIKIFRNSST